MDEDSDIITRIDAVEKLVILWDPSIYHLPLLRDHFFHTVDEVISLSTAGFPDHLQSRAERMLQVTLSRLEDKFCRLMMRNRFLSETELQPMLHLWKCNRSSNCISAAASDHYHQQPDIASAISNSSLATPQTSSDYNTHTTSPPSFSSYSAEHPDEYRSALEDNFCRIVDASEIFIGDIVDLKAIADRMIRANHEPRLTHAFVTTCSEIVTNDFSHMGFRELARDEARTLPWDAVSHELKNWVRVTRLTFQIILPRKRWLCDEVFSAKLHGMAFNEAAKCSVMPLIKVAKIACHWKRSAKIIFHLLSMYETLLDASTGVRRLFADAPDKFVYEEIEHTIHNLGNAILGILPVWLQDLALDDLSHSVERKEGIHPFTKYAMSYILLLVVNHRNTLNLLLHDELITDKVAVVQGQSEMTPLGHKVVALLSNLNLILQHKSENMEPGIREIFLINNLRYVLDSVKDSELKAQLRGDWTQELEEQIEKLLSRYLRSSWGNMLEILNNRNLPQRRGLMFLLSTYKTTFRWKIKTFSSAFEATCNLQSSWKVPDPQLRREIRMAISHTIIPTFNFFLVENHRFAAAGVDREIYTAEALEDRILGLFEGS